MHAEATRGAAYRQSVKVRSFDKDIDRVLADLRVGAAHDSRETDHPLTVGDHRHIAVERPALAVEGHDLLPGNNVGHL